MASCLLACSRLASSKHWSVASRHNAQGSQEIGRDQSPYPRRLAGRKSLLVVLILALVVLIPTLSEAQATAAGTVVGVITDQSGAVISGAQITLTDSAT